MRFVMTDQNTPNPDISDCMNQRLFAQEINSESWTSVKENIGSKLYCQLHKPNRERTACAGIAREK